MFDGDVDRVRPGHAGGAGVLPRTRHGDVGQGQHGPHHLVADPGHLDTDSLILVIVDHPGVVEPDNDSKIEAIAKNIFCFV